MHYLAAVSGGIDSVVLLDMLVTAGAHKVTVAHFDHGIRDDSAADARFVEELAAHYGVPCVTARAELGRGASEAAARQARYVFLEREANARGAVIATAHHADDVAETIALNLTRGTGWRGLAVLDHPERIRPLLTMTKAELRAYALAHRLEWVEDSTNAELTYLRNRLRRVIAEKLAPDAWRDLGALRQQQCVLKAEIDAEVRRFLRGDATYRRYFFTVIDDRVAVELLRAAVASVAGHGPTRPQAERALLAIKTAPGGTTTDVGEGVQLRFTSATFVVELKR